MFEVCKLSALRSDWNGDGYPCYQLQKDYNSDQNENSYISKATQYFKPV